jgi:2-haloacid dehalogenase
MMHIKALTFDYFGTLVDVDKGGAEGMRAVLSSLSINTDKTPESMYLDWDIRTVRLYRGSAYQPYRQCATRALEQCIAAVSPHIWHSHSVQDMADLFLTHLMESSTPHPDAVEFLEWVKPRFPLMPITNMDTELWQRSRLVKYFDQVTTAEMAKAYKPSYRIFDFALDRLMLPACEVLHCSLSRWADIDGAKPLGMNVAWINRWKAELGTWQPRPDFEFETLLPVMDVLGR